MSKIAKDAFAKQNYPLAVEIFERCLRQLNSTAAKPPPPSTAISASPLYGYANSISEAIGAQRDDNHHHNTAIGADLYFWYGDSLARCGRLAEAFDVYALIGNRLGDRIPVERLATLAACLTDYVRAFKPEAVDAVAASASDALTCPVCEDIIRCPVTACCGHTFCRECCEQASACHLCNVRFPAAAAATNSATTSSESMKFMPDILVRRLVEKWWGANLEARLFNDTASQYIRHNQLDDALKFCNESLEKSPNNFKSLLLRSEVLFRLKHYQSSLADVDNALKTRNTSAKAHYQRAQALIGLGRTEEALIAQCAAICVDNGASSAISSSTAFRKDFSKIIQRILLSHLRLSKASLVSAPYTIQPYVKRKKSPILATPTSFDFDRIPYDMDNHNSLQRSSRKHCRRKTPEQVDSYFYPQSRIRIRSLLDRIHEDLQKFQKADHTSSRQSDILDISPSLIDASDFDCVLCCRTLWKPVVTPCGHTYCWVCLDRCMDYSSSCPLCMSPLIEHHTNLYQGSSSPVPLVLTKRPVTKFLESAMKRFIPDWFEKRFRQEMESEPSVPVFICTTAFPYVPCPLFVYEPRYRLMVRRAIESGERQFGIVHPQSGKSRHFDVGTMLDIRDCVLLGDGCSILSTIGCRRFKILTRNEKDGYETAKVEYIYDETISEESMASVTCMHDIVLHKAIRWYDSLRVDIKEEILRSFGPMPVLENNWETIGDGPAWAWWIIAILPLNQQLKVDILATTSLKKRLRAIEKTLDYMAGTFRRSQEDCVVVQCEGLEACQTVECCQRTSTSLTDDTTHNPTPNEHSELLL